MIKGTLLYLVSMIIEHISGETVSISSSCNGKTVDGVYYIKPTEEGAVIPVICSGGFTMLDASLNYNSLSTYFTSMFQYGDEIKMMYGTDCSDSSGWRDWYIPANNNTSFRVALNCDECKTGAIYGDNTAYYMTNAYFCPVNLDIDGCSANKDLVTRPDVMCNICDDDSGICGSGHGRDGGSIYDTTAELSWCDCYTLQLTADHRTTPIHSEYCQQYLNWRPNIVIDRTQCTCYKPLDYEMKIYNVSQHDLPLVNTEYKSELEVLYISDNIVWDWNESISDNEESQSECLNRVVYLSNSDFVYGTYRIMSCGNYILTEDIVINFNKPLIEFNYSSGDSPNRYDLNDLYWFPNHSQQESGEYFGFDAFWGPYSLGFFCGISIESKHVYIDLNSFSISMDYEYYLQQRFFAIIEFGNKQFESHQGPVDFGRDDICNSDISIKNGVLGLSSHHGIHGSCVSSVNISSLQIVDFDVCGIQCNGCFNVLIEESIIGPQNIDIPVLGRYTHSRIVLSRLRYLVDEYGSESVVFANRNGESITVRELADKLVTQMDMIYYHIMQGIEFDSDEWSSAKHLFLNPNGWMDGGSSYGILLNGLGTAVVNIGRRLSRTWDITIRNVQIVGIKQKTKEGFWAQSDNRIIHGFFFETIDWNGDIYDDDTGYYIGDAYTDILFVSSMFLSGDFCPLGSLFYLDGLMEWAFTDKTSIWDKDISIKFECGSDIQSHSAKGVIGIRIDGTQRFNLQNIYIHDLVNWADLGSNQCGEYEQITFENGVDVDKDIQYGYTATKVHGILTDYAEGSIKNINISDLESWHGTSIAISIYKGSAVQFDGYVTVNNIMAASKLSESQIKELTLPNAVPFLCSIYIGPNSDDDETKNVIVTTSDDFVVKATNLFAINYCHQTSRIGNIKPQNNHLFDYQIILFIIIFFIFSFLVKRCCCYNNVIKHKLNQNTPNYGSI